MSGTWRPPLDSVRAVINDYISRLPGFTPATASVHAERLTKTLVDLGYVTAPKRPSAVIEREIELEQEAHRRRLQALGHELEQSLHLDLEGHQ